MADQNCLRGVQVADASGVRPYAHFEVYADLGAATSGDHATVTSQLALPEDACTAVHATDGYGSGVRNLAQTSLDSDMVVRDGYAAQLATVSGDGRGQTLSSRLEQADRSMPFSSTSMLVTTPSWRTAA